MSAIELYKILFGKHRAVVAKRAVAFAEYPADTAFDDVIDHDDHPALVEALRNWWHDADVDTIAHSIERYGDQRASEVAVLLCAESVSHMTDDPRAAECRRVRIAWVRGEATDKQRMEAFVAANSAARDTDRRRTARYAAEPIMGRSTAAGDIVSVTVWVAAFSAALCMIAIRTMLSMGLAIVFTPVEKIVYSVFLTLGGLAAFHWLLALEVDEEASRSQVVKEASHEEPNKEASREEANDADGKGPNGE